MPPIPLASLQFNCRNPVESNRARLYLESNSNYVAQSPHRHCQTQTQGNGQPLPFHLPLRLVRKILQSRRLPERHARTHCSCSRNIGPAIVETCNLKFKREPKPKGSALAPFIYSLF